MSNSSEAIGQTPTSGKRPHSKILIDGGDPQETRRIRQLIGFVDGQTTNPSLIAKRADSRTENLMRSTTWPYFTSTRWLS
jgi:transaldolase